MPRQTSPKTPAPPLLGSRVGKEWVADGPCFENVSPADGAVISMVSEAGASVVDRAVAEARRALDGGWGDLAPAKRGALLERVAAAIEGRLEDLAVAEATDTGKPLAVARELDIPRGAANFRAFARLLQDLPLECFETRAGEARALNYAVRRPAGVVAAICPWNLPFLLMTWKVAPALAAGNAVVVKPSEETPTTATLLAEILDEAGAPPGVFNLVHGRGAGSAGELLARHPGVDALTFTGESATGREIMRLAADGVRKVSFELGGKNPAVIFADADADAAAEGTARSVFSNCGQVCLCTERVYVEEPLFDEFVGRLRAAAEAHRLGGPFDGRATMGPLISREHRSKVLSYYDLAREEGATVVAGGGAPEFGDERDRGAFVEPTVLAGLPESARCVREEIFGPVCHVAPFRGEDEAVALANDTDYGLAAALWTTDVGRAHRVARRIAAGTVWVNCWYLRDLRAPFGGMGLSGIGREGGTHSLDFYSELTNVCVKF